MQRSNAKFKNQKQNSRPKLSISRLHHTQKQDNETTSRKSNVDHKKIN